MVFARMVLPVIVMLLEAALFVIPLNVPEATVF